MSRPRLSDAAELLEPQAERWWRVRDTSELGAADRVRLGCLRAFLRHESGGGWGAWYPLAALAVATKTEPWALMWRLILAGGAIGGSVGGIAAAVHYTRPKEQPQRYHQAEEVVFSSDEGEDGDQEYSED